MPEPGGYAVTSDRRRIDVDAVERFLRASHWAANRSRARIERSMAHSLCFAVLDERCDTVAFARVVTDCADFAWLCDVFVDPAHRGRGLSRLLLDAALSHPDLCGLRRWLLATQTAGGLYEQYGFAPLLRPEIWMERFAPGA